MTDVGDIVSFRAGFNDTPTEDFVDVLADLNADGTFTFSPRRLTEIYGDFIQPIPTVRILDSGEYTLRLMAEDQLGNISAHDFTFTVDVAWPRLSPRFTDNTGLSRFDRITSDPSIGGSVRDLSQVTAFRASFVDVSSANDFFDILHILQPDGSFAIDQALVEEINGGPLADGDNAFRFWVQDEHGQGAFTMVPFTLDTTAPDVPTIPGLLPASDGGVSDSDNITNIATPTISVTAEAGSQVQFLIDGVQVAEVTADAAGEAQFVTAALSEGVHQVSARAVDVAGNVSAISEVLEITVDTTAPSAEVVNTLDNLSTTIDLDFGEAVAGDALALVATYALTIVGGANDGDVVDISSVATVDAQTVRLTLSSALAFNDYALSIAPLIMDVAGNRLMQAQVINFTVADPALAPVAWQFDYDDADRITQVIDPAGQITQIDREFDALGNLTSLTRTLDDGSQVGLALDGLGRLATMTDSLGSVTYGYDEFSRLTSVSRTDQPVIAYSYDTEDRITSVSVGDQTTAYTYDFLGRLAQMDTPAGTVTYEYLTGRGELWRTLPNGVRTIWKFEPDGNLGQLTHVRADNTILARFTYDYRPDGLISEIQEWSPTEQKTLTYEYDEVQRLTAVDDSILGRTEYTYDAVGNRTGILEPGQDAVESTYDWANRLETYDGQAVSYDAAGNLTQYGADADQRAFSFNASGLLDEVTVDGQLIDYEYDGDGNLVSRTVGSDVTNFVTDPLSDIWRPFQMTDGNGTSTFIWEGETPLATSKAGEEIFFLQDHLGSVRFRIDENGNVIDKLDYETFGKPTDSLSINLQSGFSGLFFDSQSNLYLTRARAYEPGVT